VNRLGVSALLVAAGCVAEPVYPPIEWHGEHVDFGRTRTDEQVCAGTFAYLDAFAGITKSRVGTASRVQYFWVEASDLDDYCAGGTEDKTGCAKPDGTVFAEDLVDEHEVVHGTRAELDFAHRFVEEGLATAWGFFPALAFSVPDRTATIDVMQSADTGMSGTDYLLAADFIGFILGTEGYQPLDKVTRKTDYASSYAQLEAELEASVGVPVGDLTLAFAGEPGCAPREFTESVVGCAEAPLECDVDGFELEVSVGCGVEDVVGPTEERIFTQRTFSVPSDGEYLFRLQGPEDNDERNEVFVRKCESGCSSVHTIWADADLPADVWQLELEAGTYVVTFVRDAASPADYVFSCLG
jgi:hypothetical protein